MLTKNATRVAVNRKHHRDGCGRDKAINRGLSANTVESIGVRNPALLTRNSYRIRCGRLPLLVRERMILAKEQKGEARGRDTNNVSLVAGRHYRCFTTTLPRVRKKKKKGKRIPKRVVQTRERGKKDSFIPKDPPSMIWTLIASYPLVLGKSFQGADRNGGLMGKAAPSKCECLQT